MKYWEINFDGYDIASANKETAFKLFKDICKNLKTDKIIKIKTKQRNIYDNMYIVPKHITCFGITEVTEKDDDFIEFMELMRFIEEWKVIDSVK